MNWVLDSPYPITEFYGYQSFGFSLSHSIYFNVYRIGEIQGYVTSVTLRLFTDWKGDNPLYIFAINQLSTRHCEITHRYPIIPKRNNIECQTIQIHLQIFPIFNNNFIAIGMQDESNTNQIYAVKAPISIGGENITNDTRYFYIKGNEGLYGIAFMYTVFPNGKKVRMEEITVTHSLLLTFIVLFLYDVFHAKENSFSCAFKR
jgi:hypothetical protein